MSLRTFTDNVVNLAIEGCLVSGIPGIMTPQKVNRMTNEQLKDLAAESDDAESRRDHLEAEVAILCEGHEQCRKYRRRGVTCKSSPRLRGKSELAMLMPRKPSRRRRTTQTSL